MSNLKNGTKCYKITGWARLIGSPTGVVEFTASAERAALACSEGAKVSVGTLEIGRIGSNRAKTRTLVGAQQWTPEDAAHEATLEDAMESGSYYDGE